MKKRELSLLSSPSLTLYYFSSFVYESIVGLFHAIFTHPVVLYLLIPIVLLYFVVDNLDGAHQVFVTEMEHQLMLVAWWVGLGILSSVGLGTGLHTGLLFLFPHIFKVCMAASSCLSVNFNSREMWFLNDPTLFVCQDQGTTPVAFFEIFKKVAWPCFLWGTGTALGEIPPYAISRAAKMAGETNEEFEDIKNSKSQWQFLDQMKMWTVNFLQKHGFIGIILMASWPNAAFDLCGICCGHFEMPFWEFITATWIGKALIKANFQAAFFLTVFTDHHLENAVEIVERVIPDSMEPCNFFIGKDCHHLVKDLFHKARAQFHKKESGNVEEQKPLYSYIWPCIIGAFLTFFIFSCVNQVATMQYNKKMNQNENQQKESKKKV